MMSPTSVLIFVSIAVTACYGARVHNHRCRYFETKLDNCTRQVYTPCQNQTVTTTTTTASPADNEDYYDDDDDDSDIFNFINQIMRRYRYRSSSFTNWCKREETFSCVKYRCYVSCCPNWKYDPKTKKCSIWTGDIECQNGGTAYKGSDGKSKCRCQPSFTGSVCEEPKCYPDCMNDGMCDSVGGVPKCICPNDFNGTHCETPVCKGGCNNGHCEASGGEAMCLCKPDYTGMNCEHRVSPPPEKPGDCPLITSGTCYNHCMQDSDCSGSQKCCSNDCGRVCSYTANYTCPYNGRSYRIGQTFRPDACTVCTCIAPDPSKPYGGAQCSRQTCPPLDGCENVRTNTYTCCPFCADKVPTPEDSYKKPLFLNCPRMLVTMDVGEHENRATLPFTLDAEDHRHVKLKVTMSRSEFSANTNEINFDTVIATSFRDYHGNYATCTFRVRIRDVHPPTFTNCPADVMLEEPGQGNWDVPVAEDNVGVFRKPRSRYSPSHHFTVGEHPVVYTAEDYEGNAAYCRFFVKVGRTDQMKGSDEVEEHGLLQGHNKLYLLAGGLALALLVIVVVLVACVCCRRRREPGTAAETTPPPAYDNAVYSMPLSFPPAYKENPQVFVDHGDKTLHQYEELRAPGAKLSLSGVDANSGVDNPTYEK